MTGSDFSRMGKEYEALFLSFVVALGLLMCGAAFGVSRHYQLQKLKTEAIQRGYAEHNPTNGVWQWKEAK